MAVGVRRFSACLNVGVWAATGADAAAAACHAVRAAQAGPGAARVPPGSAAMDAAFAAGAHSTRLNRDWACAAALNDRQAHKTPNSLHHRLTNKTCARPY